MKVKTAIRFKDKNTGEVHEVGDVFIVSKKRYQEILEKGEFVVPLEFGRDEEACSGKGDEERETSE